MQMTKLQLSAILIFLNFVPLSALIAEPALSPACSILKALVATSKDGAAKSAAIHDYATRCLSANHATPKPSPAPLPSRSSASTPVGNGTRVLRKIRSENARTPIVQNHRQQRRRNRSDRARVQAEDQYYAPPADQEPCCSQPSEQPSQPVYQNTYPEPVPAPARIRPAAPVYRCNPASVKKFAFSPEELEEYYPVRALELSIEGRATLSCAVGFFGTYSGCNV